jgi:hypothetical protein
MQRSVTRTWGLKPKVVYWLYTVAEKPMVTSDASMWWHRVKFKTSRAELSKIQRMTFLGITGALRTAPTSEIEFLLGVHPLSLQLEAETRAGIYRLYCSDHWKPKSEGSGHA